MTEIRACRACQGNSLTTVLDLGNLAVSDFPDRPGGAVDRAPLELARCEACGLVQLRHTVDRDRLYRTYWYRSGVNAAMTEALQDVVRDASARVDLKPGDWVLDVGCNDGTLLDQYPTWVNTVGFEPSQLAEAAVTSGAQRRCIVRDYFPPTRYPVDPVPCKIVTACAVFYDLDDPGAFLEECKRWLHPEGVLVLQFQDLTSMLKTDAVDNVCHEHLTYWDKHSLVRLTARHGLCLCGVSREPVNGGSLRLIVRPVGAQRHVFSSGLPTPPGVLTAFAERVERHKHDTMMTLRDLKAEGKRVYGIAASTKFSTLSQFYGIGPDLIEAIGERSPDKVGRYTVTGIPIVSEEEMRAAKPDYLFCCAWQFAEAFAERERALLEQGTKLIVPLPELKVISFSGDTTATRTVAA